MNTEIWVRFIERLKMQINERCKAYIENLSCAEMTETEWILCLPDRASLNFVESNLSDKLCEVLGEVLKSAGVSTDVALTFSIEGEAPVHDRKSEPRGLFDSIRVTDVSTPDVKSAALRINHASAFDHSDVMDAVPFVPNISVVENSRLNPRYTFDTFIKGDSNEMAYCAAKAVAANPASSYNPLFIYGGVGVGKTHLMHAIGNEILETSKLRVIYMTSEEFTNQFMDALQNKKMQEFRDNIRRNCDVLLLDDIQFIAGKEQTQKEFFNVFNDLQGSNKQIVLTSDKHPKEIRELEDRMTSRFMQGLMADIQLPEYETRLEIVRKKSRAERFYVPDEVAQYIASKVTSNVRELEGVIKGIKAWADIHKEHISMELARRRIEPYYQTKNVLVDASVIINKVSRYFGLSADELLGKSRAKQYVYPRQIAMYLARSHTSLSYPDLGRAFNRDHSTVLSAVQRVMTELSEKNPQLQGDIKYLEDELFK